MMQLLSRVIAIEEVGPRIFVLTVDAPAIAASVLPGQFVNIKVNDLGTPLLRRPFSVYQVSGSALSIIFNTVGLGTSIMASKRVGETLDLLGPLGRPYGTSGEFDTALLVAGGLGVAPLPLLTSALERSSKRIATFLGARTKDQLVGAWLRNVLSATDDGSEGFAGTVVALLESELHAHPRPKIFACGPNPMLAALAELAAKRGIPCELSLESAMACGIGICQGCPVEQRGGERKYALICKEGPVFDATTIKVS